jgi:uncharacterized protein YbcI
MPELNPVLDPASVDGAVARMSNEVRAVCKRHWGRGPEWAGVLNAGNDAVVVLFNGFLTHAERSLLAVDQSSLVQSTRAALHELLEPDIRAILERNVGRETDAVMCGVDVERDVASIVVTFR